MPCPRGLSRSIQYFQTTDDEGIAIVNDLPGKRVGIGVNHDNFEMSATGGNRFIRSGQVRLTPGTSMDVTITMQPKGEEVLGR